jgi:dephospho-CoA kinase
MVYSVALTGNIASGKSTVAKLFSDFGIEIINADAISRELSAKNNLAYKMIVEHFGTKLLLENGEINRAQLRELIFTQPEERIWLENLLHPLIRERLKEEITRCTSSYCVVEIPLLIDKVHYPYINKILLITAPIETQIKRVVDRDHCSREQALAILSAQPENNLRLQNADDHIYNHSGLLELKLEVELLHNKYLKESLI